MKINIKKIVDDEGDTLYLIECLCGEEIILERIPEWFKCPSCKKLISLFKIQGV